MDPWHLFMYALNILLMGNKVEYVQYVEYFVIHFVW